MKTEPRTRAAVLLVGGITLACGPELPLGTDRPCRCPSETEPLDDGDFVLSHDTDALHLEVEDFAGPWARQSNLSGFSGWGFAISNARGVATSRVVARVDLAAARYTVWTRGYADKDDRAFRAVVNGTELAITHRSRSPGGFAWERAGEVEIEGGITEVAIVDAGLSFEAADAVLLVADDRFRPSSRPELQLVDRAIAKSMLLGELVARADRYSARRPFPETREEWLARAGEIRPRIMQAIGLDPLPERTPLSARITGTSEHDGYRIERVLFESRPGFPVTANVLVPDGDGPFPVVLSPLGHVGGKGAPQSATRAHGLAKLGHLVITYDPFGQGERDISGNQHRAYRALALTGHHNLTFMIWDSMRALDYVLSRADADPSRVACTGESGGGLNTLFLSVADPRINASVPVAFVTTFAELIGAGGSHEGCAYLPGLASFTDMDEIAALFGPRAQLFIAGDRDPQFPIAGTIDAHRGTEARYRLLGAEGAIQLARFPVGHEYGRAMRETMYGFLGHVFRGDDLAPVAEPYLDLPSPNGSEIRVTPAGRVPSNSRKVIDFAREWGRAAIEALPGPEAIHRRVVRAELKEVLTTPEETPAVVSDQGEIASPFGFSVRALSIEASPGIELPAYFVPGPPSAPVIVVADDGARPSSGQLAHFHRAGLSVLSVVVRGTGETAWDETAMFGNNLLLGDSLIGQRAFDLAQAAQVARQLAPGVPVGLLALGRDIAPAGLFAQALFLPFDAAAIGPLFSSYLEAYDRGIPNSASVHRLLRSADIAHVSFLAAEHPLLISFDEGAAAPPARFGPWHWLERTDRLDQPEALRWLAEILSN